MHIVLTGVTGFVGRAILMRLLADRDQEIERASISILIRSKRNKSALNRWNDLKREILECFLNATDQKNCNIGILRKKMDAISLVTADLTQKEWIENIDQKLLGSWTHFILCAASVEFNHPIPVAFKENVVSLYSMLLVAQRCVQPIQLIYISTTYVCIPSETIKNTETLYPIPAYIENQWPALLTWVESMGKDKWELGSSLDRFPNTYTLSKCTAERFLALQKYVQLGSISIVRPSIVGAAFSFPYPAWFNGFAAYLGLAAIMMTRVMPVMPTKPLHACNIIPVDLVSYAILLALKTPVSENEEKISNVPALLSNLSFTLPGKTKILRIESTTAPYSPQISERPLIPPPCKSIRIWNCAVSESHVISVWLSMKIGERILRIHAGENNRFFGGGSLEMENSLPNIFVAFLKYKAALKRIGLRAMAAVTKNQAALKGLASVEDAPNMFFHFLNNRYMFESSLYNEPIWRDWSVEKYYHDMNAAVWKKTIQKRSKI